jgi:peptidoglycan/LPS O-acetylase OafA/YrhL
VSGQFSHFKQLDGWRGVSIILVLIGHLASYSLCLPTPLSQIGEFATLGVLCFFILSGFLITGLLCEEERKNGHISLRLFYIRRILRIIPAYYLLLFISAALIALGLVTDVPWYSLASCFAFLRDLVGQGLTLGHLWSLALEEQFYLVWPVVLSTLPKKYRVTVAFLLCILVPIWRGIAIVTGIWAPQRTFRPDFRIDCILIGCLIALLHANRQQMLASIAKWSPPDYVLAVILLAWTLSAGQVSQLFPIYITIQLWLAALIVVNLIVQENSHLAKGLTNPILRWFGMVSYSIYLWQQPFIASKIPSWGLIRVFPIDLALALLTGSLSYYFVERPFLRLKDRFTSAARGSQAPNS